MTAYALASLVVMLGLTALVWTVAEWLAPKIGASA
jgi:hypothetical protein